MLGIGDIYLKHFVKNIDSRWVLVQGGRRSGKSWAIHRWLRFLASGKNPKTVMCVTASYPQMQLCLADFEKSTGVVTWESRKYGRTAVLPNGSRWLFKSFDKFDKAQGSSCDYLFLNEALQIPEDIISTISMSVTTQIYADYNPSATNILEKYLLPDGSNYIKTTFKDNPYLSEAQIQEFEDIKTRAQRPGASLLDQYSYAVYYKGDFANMGGKVFKSIYTCTQYEYKSIPVPEIFGLDFGWIDNNDETALIGCKIWQGNIYGRQVIYSHELANNKKLALAMADAGISYVDTIVADYGGLGSQRIKALISADNGQWTESEINQGFSLQNARKTKIIDGLMEMNNYDKIILTEDSIELRREMEKYELTQTGSPKSGQSDHGVDALRYAVHAYKFNVES